MRAEQWVEPRFCVCMCVCVCVYMEYILWKSLSVFEGVDDTP